MMLIVSGGNDAFEKSFISSQSQSSSNVAALKLNLIARPSPRRAIGSFRMVREPNSSRCNTAPDSEATSVKLV